MATSSLIPEVETLKTRLRTMWMAGDYDRFSRYMEGSAREFYDRIPRFPGCTFLDVGCGSGQLALIAARDGLHVTGVDIAANLIERARSRAQAENLQARFEEADAEALPFEDESFDVVGSLIGAMFAPQPETGTGACLQARWNDCNGELDSAGVRGTHVQSRVEIHCPIRHALPGLVGRRSHGARTVWTGAHGTPLDQASLYLHV